MMYTYYPNSRVISTIIHVPHTYFIFVWTIL